MTRFQLGQPLHYATCYPSCRQEVEEDDAEVPTVVNQPLGRVCSACQSALEHPSCRHKLKQALLGAALLGVRHGSPLLPCQAVA